MYWNRIGLFCKKMMKKNNNLLEIKKMKLKKYLFIMLLLSLTSCVSVYFDQPQPNGGELLTSLPKEFQGKWLGDDDTININSTCLEVSKKIVDSLTMTTSVETVNYCLCDSVKMYKAGNYYIANLFKEDFGWEIFVFEIQKNGDLVSYYPSSPPYMGKRGGLEIIKVVSTIINEETLENDEIISKSIKQKNNQMIRQVFYKGQFRVKDVKKVIKEDNKVFVWKLIRH